MRGIVGRDLLEGDQQDQPKPMGIWQIMTGQVCLGIWGVLYKFLPTVTATNAHTEHGHYDWTAHAYGDC